MSDLNVSTTKETFVRAAVQTLLRSRISQGLLILLVLIILVCLYLKFRRSNLNKELRKKLRKNILILFARRMVYRMVVYLSLHSYMRAVILLPSVIVVHGIGGLLLYVTGSGSFMHCFSVSWTVIAQAINLTGNSIPDSSAIVVFLIRLGSKIINLFFSAYVNKFLAHETNTLQMDKVEEHIIILGWNVRLVCVCYSLVLFICLSGLHI